MSVVDFLKNENILSVSQFRRADLESVFAVASGMSDIMSLPGGSLASLHNKVLVNLFYEPSTRTSSSFEAAMIRLGGKVISINEVHYSSVSKGESLPDTIRTLGCYADAIVLRHPVKGAAAMAAMYSRKPIINAGDGSGEHPTQAILDLYTITREAGEVDGLNITFCGDLRYGRTVHSLVKLLTLYDVHVNLVSPASLKLPDDIIKELNEKGMRISVHTELDEVIDEADVLYVTRVQKERFDDLILYEKVKGTYVITPEVMGKAKGDMILMHPFPRVGEISMAVDSDPRAAYFRQMQYGLYVRMALLSMVMRDR